MATTTRKNLSVKALQAHMAKAKKKNARAFREWELSCNTNKERGNVPTQDELMKEFSRRFGDAEGATKVCHLHDSNGERFEYIVLKRHKPHGYVPSVSNEHDKCTGNQLLDEIDCWVEFAERPEADYLCPILKYFTSKSDKVTPTSATMQRNIIIIAQKAVFVGDAEDACKKAMRLNAEYGLHGTDANERYDQLAKFAKSQNWRDAMYNGGNSGVIFDYHQNCYKAVFIDYAL